MRADRPSSTAVLIARSILLAAQRPDYRQLIPAGDPPTLARLLATQGPARWFDFVLRHRWSSGVAWRFQHLALPGIFLHYLARKRWIERTVGDALGDGIRQLVVLGAGFDLMAWRLRRGFPDVLFCELDHPATQQAKTAVLRQPGPRYFLQPADLARESPAAALRAVPGFDSQLPTCVVAEGLLMYFPAERVAGLLRELATWPRARLIFTFMTPDARGRIRFRDEHPLISRWLQGVREPFAWGIAAGQLAGFLSDLGWCLDVFCGADDLRRDILAPAGLADEPLAAGECLAVAAVRS